MPEFKSFAEAATYCGELILSQHEADKAAMEEAVHFLTEKVKEGLGAYHPAIGPYAEWNELMQGTQDERVIQGFTPNDPLLREGILHDNIEGEVSWPALGAGMRDGTTPLSTEGIVGVKDKMVQHSYQKDPVNIGDVAIDMEEGTVRIPPRSFLGSTSFMYSNEIRDIIGKRIYMGFNGLGKVRSNVKITGT